MRREARSTISPAISHPAKHCHWYNCAAHMTQLYHNEPTNGVPGTIATGVPSTIHSWRRHCHCYSCASPTRTHVPCSHTHIHSFDATTSTHTHAHTHTLTLSYAHTSPQTHTLTHSLSLSHDGNGRSSNHDVQTQQVDDKHKQHRLTNHI